MVCNAKETARSTFAGIYHNAVHSTTYMHLKSVLLAVLVDSGRGTHLISYDPALVIYRTHLTLE
jgi:hypothetical protein